eukprot:4954110-Prymnesium_polylepis.1
MPCATAIRRQAALGRTAATRRITTATSRLTRSLAHDTGHPALLGAVLTVPMSSTRPRRLKKTPLKCSARGWDGRLPAGQDRPGTALLVVHASSPASGRLALDRVCGVSPQHEATRRLGVCLCNLALNWALVTFT